MYSITKLGSDVTSFDKHAKFGAFGQVIIDVDDYTQYAAGNDSGRTLRISNPFGTQEVADSILADIRGFQYQPYEAAGAILDPAAQLGDGVEIRGVYSGIYAMTIHFGRLYRVDISAPSDEEIDSVAPYVSPAERKVSRSLNSLYSELSVQSGRIAAEVTKRENDFSTIRALLEVTDGKVSAAVTQTGGDPKSFGWELNPDSWKIHANGAEVLKVDKTGLSVKGKVTALSGTIGGFNIESNYLSYNGQTWMGTNAMGAYLGVNGIQLGKNFRVDMQGNLYASSGTFTGTIYAGNIAYGYDTNTGIDYGSLNGGAISSGSIYSTAIANGTIGSVKLSSDVNTALNQAYAAYRVTTGNVVAKFLRATTLSGGTIKMGGITDDGQTLVATSITYKDGNDSVKTLNVISWT